MKSPHFKRGLGNVVDWKFMRRQLVLFLSITMATIPCLRATAPASYTVEEIVASAPTLGCEPFGSKFFFAIGDRVIYRILPANRSDTDPAPRWEYFAPGGPGAILPVTGYESVDIVALNASDEAVGRNVTENSPTPNPHQEAALFWTPSGGSTIPAGFDAGSSGFKAVNAAGLAAGFTNSGTYRTVAWNSANPGAGVTEIIPPAGYGNCEVRGVSTTGETLLYVSSPGLQNVAIWNGTTSTVIGPAPNSDETFYPTNCAINANGDVAMAFFSASGYRLIFIPAANRAAYQIFSFNGSGNPVYNLQISDAGLASCETSVGGINVVNIVSSSRAQQFTFDGYTAFLNAGGALVFGNQGKLNYWDAAAWSGAPTVVTLDLPAAPAAPTLVGFNDDGRLLTLSDNADQSLRTLSILAPIAPTPAPEASVTVTAIRKTLRLTVGKSVAQLLARPHLSGSAPDGPVHYLLRGRPPDGTRFHSDSGKLTGRPNRTQLLTLRVAATWSAAGATRQSPFVKIKAVVRAPANPPTQ